MERLSAPDDERSLLETALEQARAVLGAVGPTTEVQLGDGQSPVQERLTGYCQQQDSTLGQGG